MTEEIPCIVKIYEEYNTPIKDQIYLLELETNHIDSMKHFIQSLINPGVSSYSDFIDKLNNPNNDPTYLYIRDFHDYLYDYASQLPGMDIDRLSTYHTEVFDFLKNVEVNWRNKKEQGIEDISGILAHKELNRIFSDD